MFLQKFCILFAVGGIMSTTATAQFIYLNTGSFKFITGIGMPIDIEMSGGSLSWFTNVQVFYKLPDNITYFEPYKIVHKRAVRSTFNRANLYDVLLRLSEKFGFFGSECIYRIICEVAQRRVNRSSNGLLGEIVHILFSPARDTSLGLEEHKEAQWQGFYNGSACGIRYKDCYLKENSMFLF